MTAAPDAARREPEQTSDTRDAPSTLTALLDHLAEELAREYVRLMEAAAREEDAAPISLREG